MTFSAEVLGFGLTTLDFLDAAWIGSPTVGLRAFDALVGGDLIDSDVFVGTQGASGLDLDFYVGSDVPGLVSDAKILRVELVGENLGGLGNNVLGSYGIDNLKANVAAPAPAPGSLLLMVPAFAGLAGLRRRTVARKA